MPIALAALAVPPAFAESQRTLRVSVAHDGSEARRDSLVPVISGGGRFIAFKSLAPNLVPRDTNAEPDIFVRDRVSHRTVRVSTGRAKQPNGPSYEPAISQNGRFVAFSSAASNLVKGDTNGVRDVFLRDREKRTTIRVSRSSGGGQGNGPSYDPAISAGGRYVAFYSSASNLIKGDRNGAKDVFVHDRVERRTVRVSVSDREGEGNGRSYGPAISGDGQVIAFVSFATNLVKGDTNREPDVFVRDRRGKRTTRASWGGRQSNRASYDPAVSGNGRFVAFKSLATNLVPRDTNRDADIFVRDRAKRRTVRVTVSSQGQQANGGSFDPGISSTGRFVSFSSIASNLVRGDTNGVMDVFVRDRERHSTRRVSVSWRGKQANKVNFGSEISAKGTHVAFWSLASNLIARKDTNGALDAFVRGRG